MGERLLGGVTREHAGDLSHALITGHRGELGLRKVAVEARDNVVRLGEHGHLGQVRDDDDLVRARQIREHGGERARHGTAHTSIHLVEDERVHGIRLTEHDLAREHDARELAARRDLPERARREAGAAPVEELRALGSLLGPLGARERTALPHELGARHLEPGHLLTDFAAEPGRHGGTDLLELAGGGGERLLGGISGSAGAAHPLLAVIYE